MRIALDGMGGDNAPQEIVAGAVQAAKATDFKIVLVGDQNLLRSELEKHPGASKNISIHHAGSFVRMDESAALSIRKKKTLRFPSAPTSRKKG